MIESTIHRTRPTGRRARQAGVRTARYAVMVVFAVVFVLPLLFMFVSSFKPDAQIFADLKSIAAFLPFGDISWDNYAGVFERVPALRFFANSLVITAAIVVIGLAVNSLAGFALARMEWRGRRLAFIVIIATLIVPFETIAVPLVYWSSLLPNVEFQGMVPVFSQGWLNTYQVQIVPFIANAFSIFLFAQYFSTIPKELDESARMDGASWFQIFRKIIAPLAGPAYATAAILTFLPAWNSYLWPLMVVQQEELRPVMVGMRYFFQVIPAWGEIMAYGTIITIPVVVLFVCLQRAFVSSIASTGMKS